MMMESTSDIVKVAIILMEKQIWSGIAGGTIERKKHFVIKLQPIQTLYQQVYL